MSEPYYQDRSVAIHQGNALDILRQMPSESVQCCVTSPPYWGLRDYGNEPIVWGDGDCVHVWGDVGPAHHPGQVQQAVWQKMTSDAVAIGQNAGSGQFCQHCNAWRGNLGLEPTIELFVEHLVEIFAEARRVLRSDGTCWLNIGDSYAANTGRLNSQGMLDTKEGTPGHIPNAWNGRNHTPPCKASYKAQRPLPNPLPSRPGAAS